MLQERLRWTVHPEKTCHGPGQFVLYWMHNAVRAHENPALDTAICWARQNGLPLLVYHAISEDYPFASDRIHCFMMQGHRDAQRELSDRGIGSYFHLQRDGHRGPHLKTLTSQAAVLVTESMPVQPLAGWVERLSDRTTTPIATVDASCVLPMSVPVDECFSVRDYREQTRSLYDDRIDRPYAEQPVDCEIYQDPLPFDPFDLQDVSLADVMGQCKIDHSIAPVMDTPGGSRAGYGRWNRYRENGLTKCLDDELSVTGVSRMSAYLHFGMVSPFRIAREASAAGACHFLDRLLHFRELSFRFCDARVDQIDSLDALPEWALKSLADAAKDKRDGNFSWETLARGKTDHPLWNASQRSLIKHGELQDELRKSWGKAILRWTSTPGRAMRVALDLNHRYALDGRDPCGYGGVLWCFGQFDKPSESSTPLFGKVRDRPLDDEQQRIDLDQLTQFVDRPVAASTQRVAVIGAGIAGLMAARTLRDHGLDVTIFEKSRGVGGRMSTRQTRTGDSFQFDHGAQYFTARDSRFCRYVQSWIHDKVVQPWTGRIVELSSDGQIAGEKQSTLRYVGSPCMNSVARHLATDLNIVLDTPVARLRRRDDDQWQLQGDRKTDLGNFDHVIVNCPPVQAAALVNGQSCIAKRMESVHMKPTWAVMLALEEPTDIPYDAAFINHGPLSWIARDSSKPGRDGDQQETWVIHASQAWTSDHLEASKEEAQQWLVDAWQQATGRVAAKPRYATAHRWLYAIPENPLDQECLWDPTTGIAACGDWCGGPRVEGAFLSGMAAAGSLLRHLTVDRR